MNKSFYTRFEFDESPVIGKRNNFTFHLIANLITLLNVFPWIRLQLFQAQRYSFRIFVHFFHKNFDDISHRKHLRRMAYSSPGHIGYMQKPVYSVQFYESSEFGNIFNGSFHNITLFYLFQEFLYLGFMLFAQQNSPGNHYISSFEIYFYYSDFEFIPYIDIKISCRLQIDLRTGKESLCSEYLYHETALNSSYHFTFHRGIFLMGFFYLIPDLYEIRFFL